MDGAQRGGEVQASQSVEARKSPSYACDKGKVHQDHAVAVRGVVASLAQQGGGLFLAYKREYEALVAAGRVRPESRV